MFRLAGAKIPDTLLPIDDERLLDKSREFSEIKPSRGAFF